MAAFIDIRAALLLLPQLISIFAGAVEAPQRVDTICVRSAVSAGGRPVSRVLALLHVQTLPVSLQPRALQPCQAVGRALTAAHTVTTRRTRHTSPATGTCPSRQHEGNLPAALMLRAKTINRGREWIFVERKDLPVQTVPGTDVILAGCLTVGVRGAGTLAWPTRSPCRTSRLLSFIISSFSIAASHLTAVVTLVPQSAGLGGAVVCPALQQPGALVVMVTVSLSYITIIIIIITTKTILTFSTESVTLLTTAVLSSSTEQLQTLHLSLGYHHSHRGLPDVRVLQIAQVGELTETVRL